jgi:trigger factor
MATRAIPGAAPTIEDREIDTPEETQDLKEALKEAIKVQVGEAGVLRKGVTITVPRDVLKKELDKEYKEIITEAIVPGFRRGRAPRRLVEKRYGTEVGAQVRARIVSTSYMAAIEKQDLKVLGDPLLWANIKDKKSGDPSAHERLVDMPTALGHIDLPEDGDFTFKCEVEIKPEFKLPELDGVAIERPALKISDEDVQVQIDRIRARRGNWTPVANGQVQADDLLICDMVMTVAGKEIKKAENIQLAARAQRIEGVSFEDFGDKLKGRKAGQSLVLEGEVPEDYEAPELRGKKATFAITINDIKRLDLPALDKQFLEAQGFDSEEEFRDLVRTQMESQLDQEIKRGMRNQVRRYLLESTKLDLPEGLSSRQTDRAVLRMMIDLQRQGVPTGEIEKHADELKTSAREQALSELKLHFIIEEIAESREIEVSEEEINAQIAMMAQAYNRRFDRVRDDLAKNNGIESLYFQIRDDKVIDQIIAKAKLTEATPQKEPKKTPEAPAKPKEKQAPEKKAAEKEEKPTAKKEAPKPAATKAKEAKPAPKKKTK